MSLPRMGRAVIINNVAAEMPGSTADVGALQAAYKDVGFDALYYSDCTEEVSASQGFLTFLTFLYKIGIEVSKKVTSSGKWTHNWPSLVYKSDAYPSVLICHALPISDFQILIKSL